MENMNRFRELTENQKKEREASIQVSASRNLLNQDCLKLMKGKCGGGFYTRYLQDDTTKIGWLQLVIEYPDDTCKAVTLYKNAFREATFDSDGFLQNEKSSNARCVTEWDTGKLGNPYILEKYASPNMPIPGQVLWDKIRENYENIPVVKINQTSPLEEVYQELIEAAGELSKTNGNEFMKKEDRCYIPKDLFDKIAEENKFNADDLKNNFDLMGLLVKDKGTKGFQYSKRVDGVKQRYYVLRKNFGTQPSDVSKMENCDDLEFMTKIKTKAEQEREKRNALIKRIGDAIEEDGIDSPALRRVMAI